MDLSHAHGSDMDKCLSVQLYGDAEAESSGPPAVDGASPFQETPISERHHCAPYFVPVVAKKFDKIPCMKYQKSPQGDDGDGGPVKFSAPEKDRNSKDHTAAKIKVVVRKRPLNSKEMARKEEDIITIDDFKSSLTVHETKLKLDLTAYVEKHEFVFDAVLDEDVSNDEVYQVTVQPIVPSIFDRTKATCFAYGQTGSGKTHTMQPLLLKASESILDLIRQPPYQSEGFQLWLSFFEIYGGKLYDLLNDRRKLCMREDGRQQVCIVGLEDYRVSSMQLVREYVHKGNSTRSTGTTGANEASSRSHAILQLAIKKPHDCGDGGGLRIAGKLSFIDLAGSERGADTTDNDRQTRIEGAEINKSLLALKECIRALDSVHNHIPFRGSKLTGVLRDSFLGESQTVMISCVSPNIGSCEHTLNTLRYADRVKGLSNNSNSKREANIHFATNRRCSTSAHLTRLLPPELLRENRTENSRSGEEQLLQQEQHISEELHRKDDSTGCCMKLQIEKPTVYYDSKTVDSSILSASGHRNPTPDPCKLDLHVSSQERVTRDDMLWGHVNDEFNEEGMSVSGGASVLPRRSMRALDFLSTTRQDRQQETSVGRIHALSKHEGHMNSLLEEEEEVISAHRKQVKVSMQLVLKEMRILGDLKQPGSQVDKYIEQLDHLLSQKATGIVSLQARLAKFRRQLMKQEICVQTCLPSPLSSIAKSRVNDRKRIWTP